jgi:hypothetical protein
MRGGREQFDTDLIERHFFPANALDECTGQNGVVAEEQSCEFIDVLATMARTTRAYRSASAP